MKSSRAARVIHPWRTSGTNAPGYSRPPQPAQQLAPQPSARPPAPSTASLRPQDAKTFSEALAGLQRATRQQQIQLVAPQFRSTAGPWIRLGEHDIRIPPDVIVRTLKGVAVLAYLDSSREAGRVQVLVARPQGIREIVGFMPEQLRQLREVFLGR
ncbi:hypothetical protein [Microbacterium sp. BLY]|uniref:hypothetical protein n=1 Tax=Microbacterium sp. BLY TaxID=2823280 RepID=UPI001B31E973|nr:hypothetical protein [Microbacterium sp. BLY]MBP3978691.1 hypothetical protein [Microbacterium sp. BLY]